MQKQTGFTLIETVLFILVLGIALGGITLMFIESSTNSNFPYQQQRALAIANSYMDEIFHKRWDENTPIGGGCVETGTSYCSNFCSSLPFPHCKQCATGLLACLPAAVATADCSSGVNCGPDGETRVRFDDIDDYNGHSATPPENAEGDPITDYAGYAVTVTVSHPSSSWNGIPARDVKQIDVTVTTPSPGNESYTLRAYRVNY